MGTHEFKDGRLLECALTHSSYANEKGLGRAACNERLEFLGDSILGYITAEYLYGKYKDKPEGELTRLRSELVCEASLSAAATRLRLGEALRLGRGEEQSGGRTRPSILADAFESTLAAIYLDGGIEAAKDFVYLNLLNGEENNRPYTDYKTRLQELIQRDGTPFPEYRIIGEKGPDHSKLFTAAVYIKGSAAGTGRGKTKKEAEQMAAKSAIERL
ncbi:MAG: ribonuclease III [Oscillospiraceae bacterium]|jgi:ribonuclease-3|nr:ribonuclease III [Oscillospiraceae bacterium]